MLAGMKAETSSPSPAQLRRDCPWCRVVCERCLHRKLVAFVPLIIRWEAASLERSSSAIGALRQVRRKGRDPAAPFLGG